jgi:hypothetical protein
MTIKSDEVAVGRCYVTATGEIRRVLEMYGGRVRYGARGEKAAANWQEDSWVWVETEKFADQAEREVSCD